MRKASLVTSYIVGLIVLSPAFAAAFEGVLLTCSPPIDTQVLIEFSPGLTCTEAYNKIKSSGAQFAGCATSFVANWAGWSEKVGSKITAAAAADVGQAAVSLKGATFSSCDFTSTSTSYIASAAGKLTLFDSSGTVKIKGGKGQFFAQIAGDGGTLTARAVGLMTKGFAVGAKINIVLGIDIADIRNSEILGCNAGALCPPDLSEPAELLVLKTDAASYLQIFIGDEADCTAAGTPYECCIANGVGPNC